MLSIEEYKEKLAIKYKQNEPFFRLTAGELKEIYAQIDQLTEVAFKHWQKVFEDVNEELRCEPMIFALPSGESNGGAVFGVVLKRDDDGDTFVYSPVPLPHLEGK
ncbi:hypothetical protein J2Z32_003046 [Paenibacillus turicensis]|uniref:Uncharacterized protein n=1 Tax=Paenibacillus turicensis TaxID=160487 RepID=A0ABS4FUY7_9BACL|nr:hypothetical protein [Paenibacillus turicensis]MBP1906396.1 hypothetical protein [Paenibacillus turicensis]